MLPPMATGVTDPEYPHPVASANVIAVRITTKSNGLCCAPGLGCNLAQDLWKRLRGNNLKKFVRRLPHVTLVLPSIAATCCLAWVANSVKSLLNVLVLLW